MLCYCTICLPLQPELLLAYSDRCDTQKPACPVISLFNSLRRLACAGAHNIRWMLLLLDVLLVAERRIFLLNMDLFCYFTMADDRVIF